MPRTIASRAEPQERYWGKRVRSRAFKQALRDTLTHELKSLAAERVADVLDADVVREVIREWDTRLIDREVLADFIIEGHRHATARLSRRDDSLLDVLDRQLVDEVEALLTEQAEPSARTEAFVRNIMRQEFVRGLFTDIIFTAIVSFNQKVNPLFGALTMRVLEEQIKGFIRLFMPMLLEQATAFAISQENQRIALDFTRAIVRQLLDQPLRSYAAAVSPARRKQVDAVIRKAVGNAKLDAAIRDATLAAWDDLYATIHDKRVGDLVRLHEHAGWLAERCVKAILPALARPHILKFIAAEVALAAGRPRQER